MNIADCLSTHGISYLVVYKNLAPASIVRVNMLCDWFTSRWKRWTNFIRNCKLLVYDIVHVNTPACVLFEIKIMKIC